MTIFTSAIIAASMAAAQVPSAGSCYTSTPGCAGLATFHNFTPSTNCVSMRSPTGAFNFCVPGNGSVDRQVPASSRYCWSGGNYAPQTACNLQWIFIPNPVWLRK